MDLVQALKAGIIPGTANPVDIILVAHKEGLKDLLQNQIDRHHATIRKGTDINEVRRRFRVTCDFTEAELSSMETDLKLWKMDPENKGYCDKTKGRSFRRGGLSGNTSVKRKCKVKSEVDFEDERSDGFMTRYLTDITAPIYEPDATQGAPLGILKTLRRKKIYKPVDDGTVTACYKCGGTFDSYIKWIKSGKHHCRACGRIFCHNCSQWKEVVPEDVISYVDTKTWIVPGQPSRVCQACKDIITNFRRIEPLLHYFEIVAYPIDMCVKASTLCRDWREAMRFYLSNVRDIQYCLPSTQLSERDVRALKSNMKSLHGHSKWILQALKMGLITIDGKRIRMCHDMMCDRSCTEHLSPFDALIILNTPVYNVEVRLLALQILEKDRLMRRGDNTLDDLELDSLHLEDMHPETPCDLLDNKPSFSRDIALFLPAEDLSVQEFILKCPDLFLDFFWLSRINYGISTDIFRNKLLLANRSEAGYVQESLRLISMLEEHKGNLCELSQQLQTLHVPFVGPFGIIEKFDHEVTVKNSATRPIIIRYYSDGEKRALLYKREDVRKDAHIVALIRIMYYLCSDIFSCSNIPERSSCSDNPFPSSSPINISAASEDVQTWFTRSSPISFSPTYPSPLDCSSHIRNSECSPPSFDPSFGTTGGSYRNFLDHLDAKRYSIANASLSESVNRSTSENSGLLSTYRVTPVSTDAGFIEIVPHSATLYDILNEGTISNYLYRTHEGGDVSVIGSNYLNSLAFWTVTTFLLGVGDRHLENIMIRRDGILFHIDYGFVFGADCTASPIRLDKNLIEGLGGIKMYEPFKARCCEIYCCLRKHFSLICSCLLRLSSIQPPITGYKFTQDFIEKFVVERFLLGQTEDEARIAFSNIIDSNRETLIHTVSDAIHSTVSSFKLGSWWS